MKYQAKPVEVDALKIASVGQVKDNGTLDIALENGKNVVLAKEMIARYVPKEGDYLVTQEDGYQYVNPKEVFERKYSPI